MQCKDAQEMLSAYIDGVLEENEMTAVEDHVRTCKICFNELTALQETVKLLNSLGEVAPPGGFRGQLLMRLKNMPENISREKVKGDGPKKFKTRHWFSGINKYLAAAVLMIGLGIGTGMYQAGALTGFSASDFATKSTQEMQIADTSESIKKEKSEAGVFEIAQNDNRTSGDAPPETGELAMEAAKDRAPLGTGLTSPRGYSVSKEALVDDKNDTEESEIAAADLPAPDSPVRTEEKSPDTPVSNQIQSLDENPAESASRSVSEDASRSMSEDDSKGVADGAAGGASESPSAKKAAEPVRDSVLMTESSEASAFPEEKVNSNEALTQPIRWILPGILVVGGIGLAGFYFGLRRIKKS